MSATILTRIRFPLDVLARLDRAAADLGAKVGRKLSRAAIVRAVVSLHGDALSSNPGAVGALAGDPVRRGRARKAGAT